LFYFGTIVSLGDRRGSDDDQQGMLDQRLNTTGNMESEMPRRKQETTGETILLVEDSRFLRVKNERTPGSRDGATAYLDKSTLRLDRHSESLIQIVKIILEEQSEHDSDVDLSGLDIPRCP
jgi:hypothetical protein